jgi:ElaB/YqjD/DUF883 family membrane-anchored ribosome-binding protein
MSGLLVKRGGVMLRQSSYGLAMRVAVGARRIRVSSPAYRRVSDESHAGIGWLLPTGRVRLRHKASGAVPILARWAGRLSARPRRIENHPDRSATRRHAMTLQSHTQTSPVGRDVQNVVSEAQELLKTVKAEGASKIDEVRSKVAAQYDAAREKFGEIQTTVTDGAKVAMTSTDAYVRSNPWRAVGIAAAAGALIGFLASRR